MGSRDGVRGQYPVSFGWPPSALRPVSAVGVSIRPSPVRRFRRAGRIQVCIAMAAAAPALMDLVDPYCAIESVSRQQRRNGSDSPVPSWPPKTKTHAGGKSAASSGARSRQVVDTEDRYRRLGSPLVEGLDRCVVVDVLIPVGHHRSTAIPTSVSDDVHLGRKERVGSTDDGADVEVVLPVLDGDVETVPALVEVGDDGLDGPVPVPVNDVAPIALREQAGIEVRPLRQRPDPGPNPDRVTVANCGRITRGGCLVTHRTSVERGYHRLVIYDLQHTLILGGLLDPNTWIDRFGSAALWGVALIVFIECWLFPFLPGDSLLFLVGLLISQSEQVHAPIWLACLVLSLAAVLSNVVGYTVGARVGPAIFNRPDSRFFKQQHVDKTYAFFDRYGNQAIVLARFVPIVRTFITLAAGVGHMPRRRFITYSAIGGVGWASGVTLLGYWLGQVTFLRSHIDLVLIAVVLISFIPIGVELLKARSAGRDPRYDEESERLDVPRRQQGED